MSLFVFFSCVCKHGSAGVFIYLLYCSTRALRSVLIKIKDMIYTDTENQSRPPLCLTGTEREGGLISSPSFGQPSRALLSIITLVPLMLLTPSVEPFSVFKHESGRSWPRQSVCVLFMSTAGSPQPPFSSRTSSKLGRKLHLLPAQLTCLRPL